MCFVPLLVFVVVFAKVNIDNNAEWYENYVLAHSHSAGCTEEYDELYATAMESGRKEDWDRVYSLESAFEYNPIRGQGSGDLSKYTFDCFALRFADEYGENAFAYGIDRCLELYLVDGIILFGIAIGVWLLACFTIFVIRGAAQKAAQVSSELQKQKEERWNKEIQAKNLLD